MTSGVEEELRRRGHEWPAPVEQHARLGSTSDRLKELARGGAPELTAVIADEQTAGRGRQGRAWASPRGGLYMSVLLRPTAESAALLPLAAGVAVAEALQELGVRAELKWPNDVLVGGRKAAGILAEASSTGSTLDWVVLGIGVNLDEEALPDDVKREAAAVESATPSALAAAVLVRLTVWYDALREHRASVVAAWRERSVPWWGQPVEVAAGDRMLRGLARDVDERGALLLDLEDGGVATVLAGDARALRRIGGSESRP
jgi:BirA family transcriptional regulator, biotin operon repressor / biotin---[acetyl-CoA-carboxylase] ligase